MRRKILAVLSLAAVGALAVVVSGMVACPLSHDSYETNRPCWDEADCVQDELCGKADGGELNQGKCNVPSDGPCGADAGFGFMCFPDDNGNARSCYYDPNYRCVSCDTDGGLPDGGCPDASCLQWNDRWGCR